MAIAAGSIRYVVSHWRGEQSLARSFWINVVLLRFVLFGAQQSLRPVDGEDYADRAVLVIALAVFAHGVVLVWQVVGALRASDAHLAGSGYLAPAWGTQLGSAMMVFLTIAFSIESWQMTRPVPVDERSAEHRQKLREQRYSLTMDASASELHLRGTIERGVTRRVETLLERTPSIERMTLESAGGNVFEARGLARLYREHELASHVEVLCASACTTAFIGGSPRTMSKTARLGFHQYQLNQSGSSIAVDPGKAQQRDQAMFTRSGVEPRFVQRMFGQRPNSMWWPTASELEAAGVVDQVTTPSE